MANLTYKILSSSAPTEEECRPGQNDGSEATPTTSSSTGFRSRGVTFQSKVDMIPNKINGEGKGQQWQTTGDLIANQSDLVKSIGSFRQLQTRSSKHDATNDDIADCIRGIELLCYPTSMRRQIVRRNTLINAVLEHQSTQQDDGIACTNAEILRDISIAHSQADVERALMLATQDEAAARSGASTRHVQRFAPAS